MYAPNPNQYQNRSSQRPPQGSFRDRQFFEAPPEMVEQTQLKNPEVVTPDLEAVEVIRLSGQFVEQLRTEALQQADVEGGYEEAA